MIMKTRSFFTLAGLAAAGLLFLTTQPSPAATLTIYQNDFESYSTVATSQADTSDADPIGLEWTISDDAPLGSAAESGVQVINWLTNSAGGANKALFLRPATAALLRLRDARSGSRYQFDFWLYASKDAPANRGWFITVRGEGADNNGEDLLAYQTLRDSTNNLIRYYDGVVPAPTGWVTTSLLHATNQWQHHRMVIDPNALTFDLYLDDMGTPVLAGVDLSRSGMSTPTSITVSHEGNTADDGYFAIDDVSMMVENPMLDLATTFKEGFEGYAPRVNPEDDADPPAPWIISEGDGPGDGRARAPAKVQVVSTNVVAPRSGTNCLKVEYGQRAGATVAWGITPQADVQVTWWSLVPEATQLTGTDDKVVLRMSLYGAENGDTVAGDNALMGYGIRRQGPLAQ